MAPRTMTLTRWFVDFGLTPCKRCGAHQESITVTHDRAAQRVTIEHKFGCTGGTIRDDDTVGEALEWLRLERKWWGEDGPRLDTIIQGLEKYAD